MSFVEFVKRGNAYGVIINELDCGQIYQEIDGFYVYWPNKDRQGFWESDVLHIINEKLDDLNRPIKESLDEYFKKEGMKMAKCKCTKAELEKTVDELRETLFRVFDYVKENCGVYPDDILCNRALEKTGYKPTVKNVDFSLSVCVDDRANDDEIYTDENWEVCVKFRGEEKPVTLFEIVGFSDE